MKRAARFFHPDKIDQNNREAAGTLFQILKLGEKEVSDPFIIPLKSKPFYIRCFFELLNTHTDIKEFENDLKEIHSIVTQHRFALDNFSNLPIDQIIQTKKTLDQNYENSWKFKVQQMIQLSIQIGLIREFCEGLGSQLAKNLVPQLKQSRNNQYYQQAYEYYNVDGIKNPKQKAGIIDGLKTEYNQYSHEDFLHKAIKIAAPYLSRDQLKKTLHYF